MIDQIRREVSRGLANMRGAMRAVLQGIAIAQRVQRINAEALAGEQLQDVELMQQFGFTSAPPDGAQLVVLPLGGRTSAAVIVATEHGSYRLQLGNQGECAIYNEWGDLVHLKKDRSIRVVAGVKVRVEAPLAEFTGNVTVAGTLTATTDVIGGGKSLKTHSHGGVTPGGGNTGAPN